MVNFILGNLMILAVLCGGGLAFCIRLIRSARASQAKDMQSMDNDPHY